MYKSGWVIGGEGNTCVWTYEFEYFDFFMEDGRPNSQEHPDIWTLSYDSAEACKKHIEGEIIPWAEETVKDCYSEETIEYWREHNTSEEQIKKYQQSADRFLKMIKEAKPVYVDLKD